jgi:hypothetical protein
MVASGESLGVAPMRLLPKQKSVRFLVNLGRKSTTVGVKSKRQLPRAKSTQLGADEQHDESIDHQHDLFAKGSAVSINNKLANMLHVLQLEKVTRPTL